MNPPSTTQLTPDQAQQAALRSAQEQLKKGRGRHFWKSLDEVVSSPVHRPMLEQEFPRQVAEWDPVNRRDFLRLMGASLALGGLTACTRQPTEKIIPYVRPPEEIIPGKPLFFATAMTLGGYGRGLLMESHMGRPTKAEGNPEHPASLGATDAFGQASVLNMYDPDRSQVLVHLGRSANWDDFARAMDEVLTLQALKQGAGIRVLSESFSSPTLAAQAKELLTKFPKAQWIQYDPVNRDQVYEGARLAFGAAAEPVYRLDRAKVIVSLDADFLASGAGHIRYARDFAASRKVEQGPAEMSRLYVVEGAATLTGASADHRLAVRASAVEHVARAMARGLGIDAAEGDVAGHEAWIAAVVRDLKKNRGAAVVIAGDEQPPVVHALAHAMNDALDADGKTVYVIDPVLSDARHQTAALSALVAEMKAGAVELLVLLGGNPVYNAPADLDFAGALKKVALCVHHGLFEDETGRLCQWHVPESHFLEAWSDTRAFDGTASVVQPLIEPLYASKSAHEIVSVLLGRSSRPGYEIVQDYWKSRLGDGFEKAWRHAVHDGLVAGTAATPAAVTLKTGFAATPPTVTAHDASALEIVLRPDAGTWDGRFANNGWLQEVPRPISKLTWDNALLVSPHTAAARNWKTGDLVELSAGGRKLDVAVYLVPGTPDDTGTLSLGYGRTFGRTAQGSGFNTYALRETRQPWVFTAAVSAKRGTYEMVTTQEHNDMAGRHHVRGGTLEEYRHEPTFAQKLDHLPFGTQPSIYPAFDYSKGNQWGMVINLNACIGCSACVVACIAENNIAVVGKDQVRRGREMHWMRIDRYFTGDDRNQPGVVHQPVTCMHCENAPCEVVCPVAATTHSSDGINQMVYNRCVGTKYCSNNCPYKVRRFNFYKFADHETPSLKLQRNPDVTVRSRGVMEKCTYCIQRISEARISAKRKGRLIEEGEVITACQQVCPSRAITFGDINDPESGVSRLRASPLHYGVFEELNTRPRTTYLARVTNPNPELAASAPAPSAGGHA